MPNYFMYRKTILVIMSLNQLTPERLYVFKFVNQISSRNTRQSESNMLLVPRARTEYFKRPLIVSGRLLWKVCKQILEIVQQLRVSKKHI